MTIQKIVNLFPPRMSDEVKDLKVCSVFFSALFWLRTRKKLHIYQEKCFLSDNILDYWYVSQGKVSSNLTQTKFFTVSSRSPSLPSTTERTCSLQMKLLMSSALPRFCQFVSLLLNIWSVSRITCNHLGGKVQCLQEHGLHDAHGKHDKGLCPCGQRGAGRDQGGLLHPLFWFQRRIRIPYWFLFDRTKTIRWRWQTCSVWKTVSFQKPLWNTDLSINLVYLSGIDAEWMINYFCKPKLKVGTEWVNKGSTCQNASNSVAGIARAIYERTFR